MPPAHKSPGLQAEVTNAMRQKIRMGQLKPGDRLPSYSAMVAEHGVAVATVDRIYNFLEQEGLIVREQGRGTFVAQPKSQARKGSIGVYGPLPGASNGGSTYWSELSNGIAQTLQAAGQNLTVVDWVSAAIAEQCDGLLIMTFKPLNEILQHVPPSFPLVAVVIPCAGVTSVVADDTGGVRQCVQHLLGLGHRKIAYLSDGTGGVQSNWRLASYRHTLADAGIEAPECWIRRPDGEDVTIDFFAWGRDTMQRWLQADWSELGFTALLTQNDEMAAGAMQALQAAGIEVPRQVSVAGFDGTPWCDYLTPSLTSVEMPLRAMGSTAAQLLLQQIEGERSVKLAETVTLPTRLAIRDSVSTVRH